MVVIPAKMGQLNRRALLSCLQQLGTASRAELAKTLSLSQPTVGRIADDLIEQGIIDELTGDSNGAVPNARDRAKAGRPGRVLSLNGSKPRFLGIHMGVRETRFALLPIRPRQGDEWDLVKPGVQEGEWQTSIREAALELDTRNVLGLILCVPGIVDEPAGKILFSPNLHWTEKTFLPDLLHGIWPLPIVMVQELRALAMGHQTLDASREDLLAVDFGDGVGAAAIIGGRVYSSHLPMSGELGHTPVKGNDRKCGCGAVGCLETIISESGLMKSYRANGGQPNASLEKLSREIMDQGAPQWLVETIDAAGSIIAGALNMIGVRRVIISGVFNQFPKIIHEHFRKAVTRGALWQRFGEINCDFAPRHHTAGMVSIGLDRLLMPATPGEPLAQLPANRKQITNLQAV